MAVWKKPDGDWLESKCGRFRIIRNRNESKLPNVWPVVYVLWDLKDRPVTLVGPYETAKEAQKAAEARS
jgi:hypothetical protein